MGLLHFSLNLFSLHTHCFQLINKSEFNSNHVLPVILLWESRKQISAHMEKLLAGFLSILRVHAYVFYLKKIWREVREEGGATDFLTQFFHLMHLKAHFQPLCKVLVCFLV